MNIPMLAAQTTQTPRLKVLVVDDNKALLELLSELFALYGHETVCVPSREAALALLETGDFDAALVDIWMSGRADGIALAREIQARFPEIPLCYMSGYAEASLDKFLPEEERKQVLHKPFRALDIANFLQMASQAAVA